jgi:hypothetical protein
MIGKRLVSVFVFLLMLVMVMPTLACEPTTVAIPTNHLEMIIHTSEPPGTYSYGNTIDITFSDNRFTLSDKYGSFGGTYKYQALNGDHKLKLDFSQNYPNFEVTLYPDGTFMSSEYSGKQYHDTGTYEWQ